MKPAIARAAMARLDVAEVRNGLVVAYGIRALLEHLGLGPVVGGGGQIRTRRCPQRRHSGADFAISPVTGGWRCHACDLSGGPIDLVGLALGLPRFVDALAAAAEIAGVQPVVISDEERARRADAQRLERERAEESRRVEEAERMARSRERSTEVWAAAWHRDARGGAYIRGRGLGPLFGRDDLVRFARPGAFGRWTVGGEPVVPVRGLDGEVLSLQVRRFPEEVARDEEGAPKIVTLPGCSTAGTLVGSVTEVRTGSTVIVTEGAIDSLTATLLWPAAAVLGAVGASRVPFVIGHAARAVAAVGGREVRIAVHEDAAGRRAFVEGARAAEAVGVELKPIDLRGAADLNAAPCAGLDVTL